MTDTPSTPSTVQVTAKELAMLEWLAVESVLPIYTGDKRTITRLAKKGLAMWRGLDGHITTAGRQWLRAFRSTPKDGGDK
jgi:hypothetical protein